MADLEFEELCCQEETFTLCDPAYKLVHDVLSDSDDSDSGICNVTSSLQPVSQNQRQASIEVYSRNNIQEGEDSSIKESKTAFPSIKKTMRLDLIKNYKSPKSEFKSLADELFETLSIAKEEKLTCHNDHLCQNVCVCQNKRMCQNEQMCQAKLSSGETNNSCEFWRTHVCQNEETCQTKLAAGETNDMCQNSHVWWQNKQMSQNACACQNKQVPQNEQMCQAKLSAGETNNVCQNAHVCQNERMCQTEHSAVETSITCQNAHVCQNERMCQTELSAVELSNSFLQMSDSGNSTLHSPDALQADILPFYRIPDSPTNVSELECSTSRSASTGSLCHWQLLDATHRALHTFIARHTDELELTIGDPIYVQREAEDLWCEGINLRSGFRGIFPSAYVVDVDYDDFNGDSIPVKKERYLVDYMGSLETNYHKGGETVIFQAINKITRARKQVRVYSCVLEVSDRGVRLLERPKKNESNSSECLDYFYSLKNVICCAFHPHENSYMGIITKHPRCDRFACHVMHSNSTRHCVEAIGRAFDKFYSKFIEKAYPTEDIYIE